MVRTKRSLRLALASAFPLVTAPAYAHPGHGRDGGSHEAAHYLTEPEHLGTIGLTVSVGVFVAAAFAWRDRRSR